MSEQQTGTQAPVENQESSADNSGYNQPETKQPDHHARSFAALMRREKQVQQKVQEAKSEGPSIDDLRVMFKTNPIKALEHFGVDYDHITNAALNDGKVENAEVYELVHNLQKQLGEVNAKLAQYEEMGQQSEEEQAVAEVRNGLKDFVAQNKEKYKLVSQQDGIEDFMLQVMQAAYQQSAAAGNPYVPSYEEVAEHVERSLLEDARKAAQAAGLWTPPEQEKPAVPPRQASSSSSLSQELSTTVPTSKTDDSLDHRKAIQAITEKYNFFK